MAESTPVVIEQVAAWRTYPVRRRVLRPHLSLAEVGLPGDDAAVHFGALVDGEVLGSLRLGPAPCPWQDRAPAWQLRSMAVDESRRGSGVGARLVEAGLAFLRDNGAVLLWCNARQSAEGFYRRCGFEATDVRWTDPSFGPHVGMLRPVD